MGEYTVDDGIEPEVETYEPFSFDWTPGAQAVVIASALLILAPVLAIVASGITWGEGTLQGQSAEFDRSAIQAGPFGVAWDNRYLDDFNGIGMVRLGDTLMFAGTIAAFVGAGVVGLSTVFREHQLTAMGGILSGIATLLVVVGLVLFPIGVENVAADAGSGDVTWKIGLILQSVAAAGGLLGVVWAFASIRHEDVS